MKGQADHFFRKAKAEGYEARSIYKLSAVDARHKILRRSDRVLDLGASPGSWAQYALERIGLEGLLVAVDIKPANKSMPANAHFVLADCLDPGAVEKLLPHGPFDVLLSDMAPRTTGVPFSDHCNSIELGRAALTLAAALLRPGGTAFVKLFEGEDFPAYRTEFAARFERATIEKPAASRKDSVETFLLGKGHRAGTR
ncbi:MAG: SAM-dependent methyltransferase [bacterium]